MTTPPPPWSGALYGHDATEHEAAAGLGLQDRRPLVVQHLAIVARSSDLWLVHERKDGTAQIYSPSLGPLRTIVVETARFLALLYNQLPQILEDLALVEELAGALVWCSGADDFQEGGKAREGWRRVVAPLLRPPRCVPRSTSLRVASLVEALRPAFGKDEAMPEDIVDVARVAGGRVRNLNASLERMEATLRTVLASAKPHYREHPTMFVAWCDARRTLGEVIDAHDLELEALAKASLARTEAG